MKILIAAFAAIVMTMTRGYAAAGGLAELEWNKSSIGQLRKLDKAGITNLLGDLWTEAHPFSVPQERDIGAFAWADLRNNGTYELLVAWNVNHRNFFNSLVIYDRDSSGVVRQQEIDGWMVDLGDGNVVRDLNGYGEKELLIPTELPPGNWSPTAATPTWPAVYRLKGGKYVEASSEFPNFYESEVLPKLDAKIAEVKAYAEEPEAQHALALLTLTKGQIFHVLGRKLTVEEVSPHRSRSRRQ